MNKFYGLIRDTNYYLFKAKGWKWLLFIVVLVRVVGCYSEFKTRIIPPSCTGTGFKVNPYWGPVIDTYDCKSSKEEEKLVCQLLQEVSKTNKKPLVLRANQSLVGPAEELAKLLMVE